MQLRLTRDRTVPIRDQLVTQLVLAIASGELPPGGRLPSTRALARRLHLHANTVSAAYRELTLLGWVEAVHGSGVFVRAKTSQPLSDSDPLDRLVLPFLQSAQLAGISRRALRDRRRVRHHHVHYHSTWQS